MNKLRNDAVYQVVGPSGSGKTLFVCKLLKSNLFKSKFNKIYWHRGADEEHGLTQSEFSNIKMTIINGFDDNWSKRLKPGDAIVVDDLYQEANKEKDFNNLFTKISRHCNVTVIFITQNLFHQGGGHRTRNLNVQYLVLFKNPRDKTVIDFLARQAYPNNRKFLMDSFKDATVNPHGYLFLDFTQQCPDELRVRSDIFNQSGITVYKQLNN